MSTMYHNLLYVSIGSLAAIFGRATTHMSKAYADGSQHSYYNKFNLLLMYCVYCDIDVKLLTENHAITFVEFLADMSTPTILTYISAIKSKCSQFWNPFTPLVSPQSEYHAQILFKNNYAQTWA